MNRSGRIALVLGWVAVALPGLAIVSGPGHASAEDAEAQSITLQEYCETWAANGMLGVKVHLRNGSRKITYIDENELALPAQAPGRGRQPLSTEGGLHASAPAIPRRVTAGGLRSQRPLAQYPCRAIARFLELASRSLRRLHEGCSGRHSRVARRALISRNEFRQRVRVALLQKRQTDLQLQKEQRRHLRIHFRHVADI